MSKLYKKIECGSLLTINQELMNYIEFKQFDGSQFWNPVDMMEFMKATPLFTAWWLDNKMPIKNVAVTCGMRADSCGPHTDTPPSRFKLSWPILNTEHTWNRWFQAMPDCDTEINQLGGVSYLNTDQLIEIDRMRVDSPALISTAVPHDVWFESTAVYPRWGLQCQLFLEPEYL